MTYYTALSLFVPARRLSFAEVLRTVPRAI